jgi:hypothetical protein
LVFTYASSYHTGFGKHRDFDLIWARSLIRHWCGIHDVAKTYDYCNCHIFLQPLIVSLNRDFLQPNLIFMKLIASILIASVVLSSCGQNTKSSELANKVDSLEVRIAVMEQLIAARQSVSSPTTTNSPTPKKKKPTTPKKEVVYPVYTGSQPTDNNNYRSGTNSYSGRCNATTKKGSQCKRTARSGGYCWQHGG